MSEIQSRKILTNRFSKIIAELEIQKKIANSENNLILYYALENAIYSFSLLDGYDVLFRNCRYNSPDMLRRPIYEIIFQNIFILLVLKNVNEIKWYNKDKKADEIITKIFLEDMLNKANSLSKKCNKENIPFYKIKEECPDSKEVIDFFHSVRRYIQETIDNDSKINQLPIYPKVDYKIIRKLIQTDSNIFLHNCLFINSIHEGIIEEKLEKIFIKDIKFYVYFIISVIQDILKFYHKEVVFENEERLREQFGQTN